MPVLSPASSAADPEPPAFSLEEPVLDKSIAGQTKGDGPSWAYLD